MRVYKSDVLLVEDKKDNILCYCRCNLQTENLLIFIQDFIRHTQCESSRQESIPYWAVWTLAGNNLQEAIGVDYNRIHL